MRCAVHATTGTHTNDVHLTPAPTPTPTLNPDSPPRQLREGPGRSTMWPLLHRGLVGPGNMGDDAGEGVRSSQPLTAHTTHALVCADTGSTCARTAGPVRLLLLLTKANLYFAVSFDFFGRRSLLP